MLVHQHRDQRSHVGSIETVEASLPHEYDGEEIALVEDLAESLTVGSQHPPLVVDEAVLREHRDDAVEIAGYRVFGAVDLLLQLTDLAVEAIRSSRSIKLVSQVRVALDRVDRGTTAARVAPVGGGGVCALRPFEAMLVELAPNRSPKFLAIRRVRRGEFDGSEHFWCSRDVALVELDDAAR